MNLKESIKRIIKEDYSPAGKEITPNSIVVHKSNPMFRDKIMSDGLKVKACECYKIYVGYGTKCKPAIFATNSTNKRSWFDSTYDDDIWFIDTRMIPDVKWYKDRHFESTKKHIVTFQDIPREAITLHYEGTGSGDVKKWGKDSPNLFESIRRILREKIEIESLVKRRLYFAEEYIENLDPDDVCKYWKDDEINDYVREGMAEITRFMTDSMRGLVPELYTERYDDVYEMLIELGYRERMENFFYESLENCDPKDRERLKRLHT
jgi:hypothetical protein